MATTIQVGDKSIGAGAPVFIIAEAGVNHNGDLNMAKRLIDVADAAGQHGCCEGEDDQSYPFQTFTVDRCHQLADPFIIEGCWPSR